MNTDLWFRSSWSLKRIAKQLELADQESDAENRWEWIVGSFGDVTIDVTRDWREKPSRTEVRIFRLDHDELSKSLIDNLVSKLKGCSRGPICVGHWQDTPKGFVRHLAFEITVD